jgi:hypothetical protein
MADHTAAPAFAGVHIAVLEQRVAALEMQAAVPLPAVPGCADFNRLWGAVRMGAPAKQLCDRIKFNFSYVTDGNMRPQSKSEWIGAITWYHNYDEARRIAVNGVQIAAHHTPLICAEMRNFFRDSAWHRGVFETDAGKTVASSLASAFNAEPDAPYADYAPVIAALPREARDVAVWRRELKPAIFAQLEPHFAAAAAANK